MMTWKNHYNVNEISFTSIMNHQWFLMFLEDRLKSQPWPPLLPVYLHTKTSDMKVGQSSDAWFTFVILQERLLVSSALLHCYSSAVLPLHPNARVTPWPLKQASKAKVCSRCCCCCKKKANYVSSSCIFMQIIKISLPMNTDCSLKNVQISSQGVK